MKEHFYIVSCLPRSGTIGLATMVYGCFFGPRPFGVLIGSEDVGGRPTSIRADYVQGATVLVRDDGTFRFEEVFYMGRVLKVT